MANQLSTRAHFLAMALAEVGQRAGLERVRWYTEYECCRAVNRVVAHHTAPSGRVYALEFCIDDRELHQMEDIAQWIGELVRRIFVPWYTSNLETTEEVAHAHRSFREEARPEYEFHPFPRPFASGGRVRSGTESEARARELLRSALTPQQRRDFDRNKWFKVRGNHTGRWYTITWGSVFNINVTHQGKLLERLCIQPEGIAALGDIVLAQKIALETDENAALGVANIERMNDDIEGYYCN